MKRVLIGIQARSTSKRLPNKISAPLGNKTVLQHVMESSFKASQYLSHITHSKKSIMTDVALLIPQGDLIKERFSDEIMVVEGPEDDVLTRYVMAINKYPCDYVVRVTADCPLIPHFVISKLITLATMNEYDYVSNVDERCRTTPDGFDCEVLSRRAVDYLHMNAKENYDREHVTTFLRRNPPVWLKQGAVINFLDLSGFKISVDTEEDYQKVRSEFEKIEENYVKACEIFGRQHVHRF